MPNQTPLHTHLRLPRLSLLLFCAFLILGASGCGTTSISSNSPTPSPTPTHTPAPAPTLACSIHTSVSGIDVILVTLTCDVRNANPGDTSFSLTYTSAGGPHVGQPGVVRAPCAGPLHAGAGTCTQTYSFIAPNNPLPGKVEGESLPSHSPLGPVTPTAIPGTPTLAG